MRGMNDCPNRDGESLRPLSRSSAAAVYDTAAVDIHGEDSNDDRPGHPSDGGRARPSTVTSACEPNHCLP